VGKFVGFVASVLSRLKNKLSKTSNQHIMNTTSTKKFWRPALGLSGILLGLIGILPAQQSAAQVVLGPSPYTQNFNSIGSGLPSGWSVRAVTNPANFGVPAIYNAAPVGWASDVWNFENLASCNSPASITDNNALQNSRSDRALGVRKAADVGNPGGAFVFQVASTVGLSNFMMNFKLMQLDPSGQHGQMVTWRVDYGFGASPASFTNASSVSPWPLKTKQTNPVEWCSQNVTVDFGSALDNYSGVVTIRIYSNALTSASGPNSTNKRPNSAIDDVSLSYSGDVTPPTIQCPAALSVGTSSGSCGASVSLTLPSASDNSGSVSLSNNAPANGYYALGTTIVTWTATDAHGNSATCNQTVTVVDNSAPSFSASASDYEAECDGAGNNAELNAWLASHGGASASDNCSGVSWSDDFDALVNNGCGLGGSTLVTFTATDASGNSSSTSASFIIHDSTGPAMTAASNMAVECSGHGNDHGDNGHGNNEGGYDDSNPGNSDGNGNSNGNNNDDGGSAGQGSAEAALAAWLANHGGATASDLCSSDITWSNDFNGLSNGCGATGSATVTFTATDACGNSSSTAATFTIQDTTAPTISDADDVVTECSALDNDNDNGHGNDDDGFDDSNPGNSEGVNNGNHGENGGHEGDWNDNGNHYGHGQTGLAAWLADHGGARASDECSSVTWSNNFSGFNSTCGTSGSATVTFTATDACGNSSSTTATFSIVDTQAPTVTCPDDIFFCYEDFNYGCSVPVGMATASDNCSETITITNDAPTCFPAGTTLVTWTAADECGNQSV